ncbi:hypothetical protein F53441_13310 [Fusarium austroafricanum]|uniref:Ecp2 effector protein-like domain-containing protein n=1 Tax=Fusarium austroafricanum TaxID=2364996 RepID=A0A8H4JQ49_9HYPO|nr:hypothetical protein F53441_13310 [Fusarium austroafricanum]
MRFDTSILSVLMAGFATASPVSENPSSLAKRAQYDMCGDSTFDNHSTGGSPLVKDCQKITRNIAGDGRWDLTVRHRQVVQYGTCAFGAEIVGQLTAGYIGNTDIIDLINDSINKFQWEGKVGAAGEMSCKSLSGRFSDARVRWGIYHT